MAWGSENWGANPWGTTPTGGVVGPPVRLSEADFQQQRLYGKDIYFRNDYDVGPHKDYTTVEGLDALRQSVLHRLITRPGEFAIRPTYGVGVLSYVKKKRTSGNLSELQARIEDQLSLEPRIEEVLLIRIEYTDNGIKIAIAIKASGKSLIFQPFLFTTEGSV